MTTEYDEELQRASEALEAFAEGPGAAAARVLEEAFATAGARIEASLEAAARSGQLNFEAMAQAILRDLARIAAENVFGVLAGDTGRTVNLNINSTGAGDARSLLANRGAIQAGLVRAVGQGGRFV